MKKLLLLVLVLGLAGLGAVAWKDSRDVVRPAEYRYPRPAEFRFAATPRSAHGLDFEEVALPGPGGAMLRGWLVPAPNASRVVIILHGRAEDRSAALPMLPAIRAAGASALAIDLRDNGLSDGSGRGLGLGMREAEDAEAAVAAMQQRGYRGIMLAGCAFGGTAAIIAGARTPAVDAVVAESPVASMGGYLARITERRFERFGVPAPAMVNQAWGWVVAEVTGLRLGLRPLQPADRAAANLAPRPLLVIYNERDEHIPLAESRAIMAAARAPKTLWQVPGSAHCQARQTATAEHDARLARMIRAMPGG